MSSPGSFVDKDVILAAAVFLESIDLRGEVLIARAHPGVADEAPWGTALSRLVFDCHR